MSTNTVVAFDVLPTEIALKIRQVGWPVVDEIDVSAGAGVISDDAKCVWTIDGRRVTVSLKQFLFCCSQDKDIDPLYKHGRF